MQRATMILFATLALTAARADQWLQEIEIVLDPPDAGNQVVTTRLMPAHAAAYDLLLFECVYRQEVPWQDAHGNPTVKVVEPVVFTYRRSNVKLVQDLDFYCNFRAPIALDKLVATYGERVFGPEAPVRIDRLRIAAQRDGATIWDYTFKAPGKHAVTTPPPPPPSKPVPAKAAFGDVDLD